MDPEVSSIADWLKNEASALKMEARPHPELARRDGDWVYLPLRIVGKMGAFKRAERLQKLEERWEKEHRENRTHIMLIPSAD